MASSEIIGLLCAGSIKYHEPISITSGEKLTRAELAGLLVGLSVPAMSLALAKYALCENAERSLIANIRVWSAGIAIKEQWRTVKGRPTIMNMAAMAVFDVVRPNRCVRCHGRGLVSMRVCPCCSGSGVKFVSGRSVADAIGVDECNYRRLWRARYNQIISYVQGLDAEVSRVLYYADKVICEGVN
jgi:hypothetical protein